MKLEECVGQQGKAYTDIQPNSEGKIEIVINKKLVVVEAISLCEEKIDAFSQIKVEKVENNKLYVNKYTTRAQNMRNILFVPYQDAATVKLSCIVNKKNEQTQCRVVTSCLIDLVRKAEARLRKATSLIKEIAVSSCYFSSHLCHCWCASMEPSFFLPLLQAVEWT